MAFWNGRDINVFLSVLENIELGHAVEVTGPDGKTNTVSTFKDVRGLLAPRNGQTELTQQEYEDVLRTFMPSKEMRAFISAKKLSRYQLMDLILGAPVSLETKAEHCRKLMGKDDPFHSALDEITGYLSGEDYETEVKIQLLKWHFERSFAAHFKAIRSALNALELKPGEILLLREAWYDEDYSEDNESRRSVPLLSLEAALRYIRDEMEEEAWEDDSECWTVLEKWGPGDNGEMEHLYTYYLIRDEIVFFEKKKRDYNDHWLWRTEHYDYALDSQNLNLPIPYQPGDIVEVDCLPFAPVKHVLLLEVGSDCCGVSALFRREDGKWDTGALKHGHCWGNYRPMLSPLYRIRSHNQKTLFHGECLLWQVQKHISGDAEKGKSLWDAFYRSHRDGLSNKELLALIGDTHGDDVLLRYTSECNICSSDVSDFWPWDAVDTEVQLRHSNVDELIFTLFNPESDNCKAVFWNKAQRKAALVTKDQNCYDAIRYEGLIYTLCMAGKPGMPSALVVRKWDVQFETGTAVYREKLDLQVRWPDAHLEEDGNRLFVVLNGKRYADVSPDAAIEAE